jgi:hypothetical protein
LSFQVLAPLGLTELAESRIHRNASDASTGGNSTRPIEGKVPQHKLDLNFELGAEDNIE